MAYIENPFSGYGRAISGLRFIGREKYIRTIENRVTKQKDPNNLDFWISRLRGEQIFADALLEKGNKIGAKNIYQRAIQIADNKAPKKFAEFVGKFKIEVNESLKKCS